MVLRIAPESKPDESFKLGLLDIGLIDLFFSGIESDGPATRSALLAIKHFNDAGGVWGRPVEPHFSDTLQDGAVAHANRMIDDEGVHAFVGPGSSQDVKAVAEAIAAPRHYPIVTPSSTSPFIATLNDDGFIFRSAMSDDAQGIALARLAQDEGYDHVAIVYNDDAWGQELARVFTSHFDGETTSVALHPEKDSYNQELWEIAESDAPALVMLTSHEGKVAVLNEVKEHGHFDAFILHNDHRSLSLLAEFPELLNDAKGTAPYGQHVTEAEGHWEADYMTEYGGQIPHSPYMRETYDAAVALMLAAEYARSTDGEAIRDALHAIAAPPGKRFPASSDGIVGALEAIRNGEDIDLDGEATTLDWDWRGEILIGTMGIWQFKDGEIIDLLHFDVNLSE